MQKGSSIGSVFTFILVCLVIVAGIYFVTHKKETAVTATDTTTSDVATSEENKTAPEEKKNTASTTTMEDTTKLAITVTKEGTGPVVTKGQLVTVNYTGSLLNGTVFDSNVDPTFGHVAPFSFTVGVGQVIRGWDQGIVGMKIGEKAHLVIPADLAYGAQSPSPLIPANSVLVFDVEIIAAK